MKYDLMIISPSISFFFLVIFFVALNLELQLKRIFTEDIWLYFSTVENRDSFITGSIASRQINCKQLLFNHLKVYEICILEHLLF